MKTSQLKFVTFMVMGFSATTVFQTNRAFALSVQAMAPSCHSSIVPSTSGGNRSNVLTSIAVPKIQPSKKAQYDQAAQSAEFFNLGNPFRISDYPALDSAQRKALATTLVVSLKDGSIEERQAKLAAILEFAYKPSELSNLFEMNDHVDQSYYLFLLQNFAQIKSKTTSAFHEDLLQKHVSAVSHGRIMMSVQESFALVQGDHAIEVRMANAYAQYGGWETVFADFAGSPLERYSSTELFQLFSLLLSNNNSRAITKTSFHWLKSLDLEDRYKLCQLMFTNRVRTSTEFYDALELDPATKVAWFTKLQTEYGRNWVVYFGTTLAQSTAAQQTEYVSYLRPDLLLPK